MRRTKYERKYTIEDLEELLDNIPYEVWIKDKEGRHKYINKVSAERMGLAKEDIIGKKDYDFRPHEMAESCMEGDKEVLSTGKSSFVEDKILVGDKEKWYEIYKTVLYGEDENKKLLGGIAKYSSNINPISESRIIDSYLDIANSTQIEEQEKLYNRICNRLKSILNCDDIALYLFDEYNKKMELNLHYGSNPVFFVQKYILDDESMGQYFDNNISVIREKLMDDRLKEIYIIRNKNKLLGALHIYYKKIPIHIQEDIIKYTCIILSFIEDNRNLQNNLKEELAINKYTQKKLEMVINGAIDIYALIQKIGNDFKWFKINKRCSELLGWSCKELNVKKLTDIIHPDDIEKINSLIERNLSKVKDISCRVFCKDGTYKSIIFNCNYIENNTYVITAKDITNLTELKRDKEDLKQAVELESLKTEFFANLSHEFKTPLNIILSAVQVILDSNKFDNENACCQKFIKYIKSIKQNSYRLLKLANNMIDMTKIDGGFYDTNIDNYNIVELVENVVQSVAEYIKNNDRTIVFDTSEEQIITACDPDQIEKIILNLLSNALKFTSSKGNIYINMDVTYDCSKLIIKVKNDGPVISEEDAEKIFKRFTQSENLLTRSVEGSGIGLSLVKSLVEMHNGNIYVNTTSDNWTEFCIELPIRKIINPDTNNALDRKLNSKVEKFNIEFSDIYNLN